MGRRLRFKAIADKTVIPAQAGIRSELPVTERMNRFRLLPYLLRGP